MAKTPQEKMEERREQLNAIAARYGYDTWTKAETAVKNGELSIERNQRKTIDWYYERRKLEAPDLAQSSLFYLSEVGELAEALANLYPEHFTPDEVLLLQSFVSLGQRADFLVSGQRDWTRNGERHTNTHSLPSEAADLTMMLDRIMANAGLPEPFACLVEKMAKKGYPVE